MALAALKAVPIILLFSQIGAANVKTSAQSLEVVTPVEKVKELLSRLQDQVAEEGKQEAIQYDKYACFCKEQADNKLYQIETSAAKIEELTAKIDQLTTEITDLDSDIGKLAKLITAKDVIILKLNTDRDADHAIYLENARNVTGAIDAVESAIEAVKESKGNMEGNTNLGALVQVAEQRLRKVKSYVREPVNNEGAAYKYTYHSNDIIATLQSLRKSFIENKNDLDKEEFEAKKIYDEKLLTASNIKKFSEQEKAEKEALSASKTEEKQALVGDRMQEQKDKKADEDFLKVLTGDCQSKANFFDSRSKARASEITALQEAHEAIDKADWGANKKLNDPVEPVDPKLGGYLQKGHWEWVVPPRSNSPTFLQRRSYHAKSAAHTAEAIVELFQRVAAQTNSAALSNAALKVQVSKDHFVKVRQIISDLIDRLEDQKRNEQTAKSLCDKNMRAELTNRDEAMATIEDTKASIDLKMNTIADLTAEVADLSEAIAANKKAVLEATELRTGEKKENLNTIAVSKSSKAAIEFALTTLRDFYGNPNPSLLQKRWVAPDSDREGKTVADLQPEVFKDEEYEGATSRSKGIVGLLEVILSDFDRTEDTTTIDEAQAEKDFNTFKAAKELDTQTKEGEKIKKEQSIKQLKADIVGLEDNLHDADTKHELALETLDSLRVDCVEGVETYEERVAKREKEIAALREAQEILENWQA